jgi:hypothetical protein
MTGAGVNVVDERCEKHSCIRDTRHWPTVVSYSMTSVGSISAFVVYRSNMNQEMARKELPKNLSWNLRAITAVFLC